MFPSTTSASRSRLQHLISQQLARRCTQSVAGAACINTVFTATTPGLTKPISSSFTNVTGQISPSRAKEILANPPRSQRGNPFDARRLYLFELYSQILNSRAVFVLQINNPTAQEYVNLKREFKKKGFALTAVRNSVFGAAVANASSRLRAQVGKSQADDPATAATLKKARQMAAFRNLFVGPCFVAFSSATDETNPHLVKDFVSLLTAPVPPSGSAHLRSAKGKTLLVGGIFENEVLSVDQVKEVMKLPPMTQLRGELVATLEEPARRLLSLLQHNPQMLVSVLKQHETNLEQPQQDTGASQS
ncbi:hypothetical protein HK102_009757 [Quaeritorhiza haematococci]|nr:hypothetical protein HK102_009757 [Quaeritorhiza haematococci]